MPGFLEKSAEFASAGADVIAVVCVNDPHVMAAWGKDQGTEGKIRMLADTRCELTKALGMELDKTEKLGNMRCQRFALLTQDGVVKHVALDEDSFAEPMLKALQELGAKRSRLN